MKSRFRARPNISSSNGGFLLPRFILVSLLSSCGSGVPESTGGIAPRAQGESKEDAKAVTVVSADTRKDTQPSSTNRDVAPSQERPKDVTKPGPVATLPAKEQSSSNSSSRGNDVVVPNPLPMEPTTPVPSASPQPMMPPPVMDMPQPGAMVPQTPAPMPAGRLSWATDFKALSEQYCVPCHGPARKEHNLDLSTEAKWNAEKREIVSHVASGDMPRAPIKMPADAKKKIADWGKQK